MPTDKPAEVEGMPTTRSDETAPDPAATGVDGLMEEGEEGNPFGFDDAMAFLDDDVPGATTASEQVGEANANEDTSTADAEDGEGDDTGILSAKDMGLHEDAEGDEEGDAPESDAATTEADTETGDTKNDTEGDAADNETAQSGDLDAFVKQVNEKFEDIGAESAGDVVKELEAERRSNDIFVNLIDEHPELQDFIGQIVQADHKGEPIDLSEVAADYFGTGLPDPAENPDAYRKAVQERERRNAQRQIQTNQREQQLDQVERQMQEMQQTAQESIEQVAEEYGLEGQRLQRFRKNVAQFINQPDADFAKTLYQGMHFDQLVERAYEKGMKQGREKAAQSRQQRRNKGNQIPRLSSSRTNDTPDTSEGGEDLADFARSLQRNNSRSLADLANL